MLPEPNSNKTKTADKGPIKKVSHFPLLFYVWHNFIISITIDAGTAISKIWKDFTTDMLVVHSLERVFF